MEKLEKLIENVNKYLSKSNWSRVSIKAALMMFEETHGKKCIAAMKRFIKWSRENKKEDSWIAVGLGHDLNSCDDKLMCPRTSGY